MVDMCVTVPGSDPRCIILCTDTKEFDPFHLPLGALGFEPMVYISLGSPMLRTQWFYMGFGGWKLRSQWFYHGFGAWELQSQWFYSGLEAVL